MSDDIFARRAFVTGAAILGAGVAAAAGQAQAQPGKAPWKPAMEKQDDWMELPGSHRLVFDCTGYDGAGGGMAFAHNFFEFNRKGYGLEPSSLAVVMIFRHQATVFGYNDVIWAKYGALFSTVYKLTDPVTKTTPVRNMLNTDDIKGGPSRGMTITELAKLGVKFAVCGAATDAVSGMVAKETKGKVDDIHAELVANLVNPAARIVPAGIVTLNRAQERGYAVAHAG